MDGGDVGKEDEKDIEVLKNCNILPLSSLGPKSTFNRKFH